MGYLDGHPEQDRDAKMNKFIPKPSQIAGGVVWFIAVYSAYYAYWQFTPTIEAWLFPVLEDQEVTDVTREDDTVCWTWKWNKQQYAQPKYMSWSMIVDGTAVEQTVVVTRKRDGNVIRDIRAASIGPGSNQLCAVIPVDLQGITGLVLRGQAEYTLEHGRWTQWQEIPIVRVPPPPPNPP